MSEVNITGLADLQKFLDQLPAKMEANIMRSALRAGANTIKAEAQRQLASNGSVKTGILSKGLKVSTRAKRGTVTASVKALGKHSHIARWIEFGTAAHAITSKNKGFLKFAGGIYKAVNHPGMKPRPFMRPAIDSQSAAAVVAVGEAIKKRLTKQGLDATGVDVEADSNN